MQGQWFGNYNGQSSGRAILNLERRNGGFSGCFVTTETTHELPSVMYKVALKARNSTEFHGQAQLLSYIDQSNNSCVNFTETALRARYPMLDAQVNRIDMTGTHLANILKIDYTTDGGARGEANLQQHGFKSETCVRLIEIEWQDFKKLVTQERLVDCIFRGQPRPFPLRTSFHRAGRTDLARFALEDVVRLRSAISSITDTAFDTGDQSVLGALVGIAQHHGYPTPFLDWTKSPYVAAYFACCEVIKTADLRPTVFAFDWLAWRRRKGNAADINTPLPALSFIEPVPLKNPRLMPQQSVLVYCNMHNIEHFILENGKHDATYLKAYVLTDSATRILRDLRMMGIYAASLFPGLDGMCRGVFEESLEAIENTPPQRSQKKTKERK